MILGSLEAVRRLRQRLVDEAIQSLAICIEQEAAASGDVRRQAEEIDRQRRAVEFEGANDRDVEMFGEWLRRARTRLDDLARAYDRMVVETARSRAGLATARTSLEAVETMLREAEVAAQEASLRAQQRELDEIAATRQIAPHSH